MSARRDDARYFQQGQQFVVPILLRESVLDSVTFRATTKHFEDQVEAVDSWLIAFIRQTRDFTAQFCRLEDQALNFHGKSAPTFMESGIVDADYTVSAMARCSDANRAYWTSIFGNAKRTEQTLTEPLIRLQQNELKEIRNLRNEFQKAQKLYDETLKYYMQQPKTKEASSLREDAFQLYERRKAYIKSSFDYTIKMSTFRAALDAALIAAFSRSFEGTSHHTSALATDFVSRPSMGRIMAWSDDMIASSRNAEEYLYTVRFDLEDELNRFMSPPRDLAEYTSTPQKKLLARSVNETGRTAKQGWLMMRGVTGKPTRYIWHRRWCYVRNGIFGWLSNNAKTGAVEESDKIGVLLCNVKIPVVEERRFCFEVLTKDSTILLQAEYAHDVTEWLAIFDAAKKEVLDSRDSNEHAFAVTKPSPEFAAAFQALEGGHGETQVFETSSTLAAKDTPKKGHAKQDSSGPHSLGVLIQATNMASSLGGPRLNNLFTKAEEAKDLNPFEAAVESNNLAPLTLAPAPINTHLTKASILNELTSKVHGPSGTQANHWGSINYGLLKDDPKTPADTTAQSKFLDAPEAAVDNAYASRETEMHERGLLGETKDYPADWPLELKRQDAQFSAIFPHARSEHVLMVIRATRSVEGHKSNFSGRVYVTLRGLYFYSQSSGMLVVQACLFSEILSVRMTRKVNYDELTFDIHDFGEAITVVYLDDADLARKRIELLLANYIADEPQGEYAMLQILQKALPDDTRVQRPLSAKQVAPPTAESSDEDSQVEKKPGRVDFVRVKLPSEPVLTEPDDQMFAKIYDVEFMITAKGLFHLLFGNRSPVWLEAHRKFGTVNVQQGAWQTVEDGTLARAYTYGGCLREKDGTISVIQQKDFQKISRRVEHLDYTVVAYRRPWEYPYGSTFFLHIKLNISFVSKTKSRLRMWIDVDWQKQHHLSRGVLLQAIRTDIKPRVNNVTHFIEREVLHRLGLQSKTSKAVRLYGRVGVNSKPMILNVAESTSEVVVVKRLTIFDLIKRYPAIFVTSLFTELFLFLIVVVSTIGSFLSTNGVLITCLATSILYNTWLSGKSSITYYQHRSAVKLLHNVGNYPVGLMARGVTLLEIDELAYNSTSPVPVAEQGTCYQTFLDGQERTGSGQKYHVAFGASRHSLAQTRNDLMVAMKVVNGIETEIVKGEWAAHLGSEARHCEELKRLGFDDPGLVPAAVKETCDDCARYQAG